MDTPETNRLLRLRVSFLEQALAASQSEAAALRRRLGLAHLATAGLEHEVDHLAARVDDLTAELDAATAWAQTTWREQQREPRRNPVAGETGTARVVPPALAPSPVSVRPIEPADARRSAGWN